MDFIHSFKKRILNGSTHMQVSLSFVAAPSFGAAAASRTSSSTTTALFDEAPKRSAYSSSSRGPPTVERGVSVDQDGKSNVWAIGKPRQPHPATRSMLT
jgi:hypothetical protein